MLARLHLPRGERFYTDAIEGLVRVNERLYRENPTIPSVYQSGARYRGRDPGEDWRNVVEIVRDRFGDCEDLAAARAGELRARGEQGARAEVIRTGPQMTHARVVRADGTIEDPSRLLGMGKRDATRGGPMSDYTGYDNLGSMLYPKKLTSAKSKLSRAQLLKLATVRPVTKRLIDAPFVPTPEEPYPLPGAAASDGRPDPYSMEPPDDYDYSTADSGTDDYGDSDAESDWAVDEGDWEQLGADPAPSNELTFVVNRIPSGFQGVVKVPFLDGRAVTVARSAATKPAAAASALSTASNLLNSPLAKALIPPQAAAMLSVIQSPTAQKAAAVALNAAKKLKFW